MISKELENRIRKTKDFAELWMKFRDMYIEATKKEVVTPEEEKSFLETKSLIARKYQALVDILKLKPTEEDRTLDVVSGVLSLKSLSTLSDMQTRKIESDWQSSYILLNKVLGHLESEKESLARVSRIKIIMERLIKSRLFKFLLIILFAITVFYVARWFRLAEKLWSRFGLDQKSEEEVN
jgi:hypothetical protein